MRQWKIALSLAVAGAVAAPFVFGFYKMRPSSDEWVPLTADQKTRISAYMVETNDCETFAEQLRKSPPKNLMTSNDYLRNMICEGDLEKFRQGGEFKSHPSALKYLALNLAAAFCTALAIFALAYVVPALARRYWRWLKA